MIKTEAYYVPDTAIRLFSPQNYFQEQQAGELWCNARQTILTLADGSKLEFLYNPGSNLPLMLPDVQTPVGFTFKDKATFSVLGDQAFMSVANEVNQNIMASQKELLKWHWKLGHANFNWIQKFAAHPRSAPDGIQAPILRMKTPSVSSCPAPEFHVQITKETTQRPGFLVLNLRSFLRSPPRFYHGNDGPLCRQHPTTWHNTPCRPS